MKWHNSYLFQLGMDGPLVNKDKCWYMPIAYSAQQSLKSYHNFDFNFDEFFCNIHFFFKLSSGRREDLKDMENITSISVQYALRHVETRWLSVKGVVVRIINAWENLCQYFLKFIPIQKTFKQTVKK